MRRQFIWMQAALCAVAFSSAAPVLARANNGQPPPHAQAHGHDKDKDKDNKDKDKDNKGKAKPQAHAWDQRFHGLDRNRNNVVSRAEWNGDDRSFRNHDWNRDGVLSGEELIAGATRPNAAEPAWDQRFHGLDRNRNNVVSRAEWNGDDRSFSSHDWNRDGVLSGDELIAGATRPTAAARPLPPPPPRPRTESDEVLFARRDVNRDNVVSRSEWVGTSTEFNRLDRNNDGVLSPYEYGVGR